jgi:serine/threonine protein kinase
MFQEIPILAQDLLLKMLQKDISQRLSADDALSHPWFHAGPIFPRNQINSCETEGLRTEEWDGCYQNELIPNGEDCLRYCA